MRGILENTLRHVYFFDHPVEYELSKEESEWHMKVRDLMDYIARHPLLRTVNDAASGLAQLTSLYKELSARVHAGNARRMEMRAALNAIQLDLNAMPVTAREFEQLAQVCNLQLAALHAKQVRRFKPAERQAIWDVLTPDGRRALAGL
jgi:hypothetical protein